MENYIIISKLIYCSSDLAEFQTDVSGYLSKGYVLGSFTIQPILDDRSDYQFKERFYQVVYLPVFKKNFYSIDSCDIPEDCETSCSEVTCRNHPRF